MTMELDVIITSLLKTWQVFGGRGGLLPVKESLVIESYCGAFDWVCSGWFIADDNGHQVYARATQHSDAEFIGDVEYWFVKNVPTREDDPIKDTELLFRIDALSSDVSDAIWQAQKIMNSMIGDFLTRWYPEHVSKNVWLRIVNDATLEVSLSHDFSPSGALQLPDGVGRLCADIILHTLTAYFHATTYTYTPIIEKEIL